MNSTEKVLVTVSLLVSNRRDKIRRCLESIKPLLDAVPSELIVVDTVGEERSDGSLAIAREYADKIVTFPWCNDFAAARNAGLSEAKGEWFLYLDDDEWFEDIQEIINFFLTGEYQNYNSGYYYVHNFKADGTFSSAIVGRMVRLSPDTCFVGKVHEHFNIAEKPHKQFSCYVNHSGYAFQNEQERLEHQKRNLALLYQEMEHQGLTPRLAAQTVQELYSVEATRNNGLQFCLECIELLEKNKMLQDSCAQWLLVASARYYLMTGDYENLFKRANALESRYELNKVAQLALAAMVAKLAAPNGRLQTLEAAVETYVECWDWCKEHQEQALIQTQLDFPKYMDNSFYLEMLRVGAEGAEYRKDYARAEYYRGRIQGNNIEKT